MDMAEVVVKAVGGACEHLLQTQSRYAPIRGLPGIVEAYKAEMVTSIKNAWPKMLAEWKEVISSGVGEAWLRECLKGQCAGLALQVLDNLLRESKIEYAKL